MNSQELSQIAEEGKLKETATSLEHDRQAAVGAGDLRKAAILSNDLGVVHFLAGEYDESRVCLERASEGFAGLDDAAGQARSLGNLARLEDKAGDARSAVGLYQQAADLLHEAKEVEDESATLKMLSMLYARHAAWLQALAAYDRALFVKPHMSIMERLLHWLYQIPLRMMGLSPA